MANIKVPGFKFAGVACGIKKSKNKDLALIVSDRPATVAALFTTNQIKSPAVLVGMKRVRRGKLQAVVVNSGNANACTGPKGLRDAELVCRQTAGSLGVSPELVMPSSTGIIGIPLPMDILLKGIESAAAKLSSDGFMDAAEAIMTTDKFTKVASVKLRLGGKTVTIAGMAKGAGMIAPAMATMLAYVLTDAVVDLRCLRYMLREAAAGTFNSVTVDGDMSTNDTLLIMANGIARNPPVRRGSRDERLFLTTLRALTLKLALQLVRDGEGATKVVKIQVEQARSIEDAKKIALSIAGSQLVKTAFYGEDPNFGRIMCAVGAAGVPLRPERIAVFFNRIAVVKKGAGLTSQERQAAQVLKNPSFTVRVRLGLGKRTVSIWTSDLSHEYVRINSAYRT
jgi:glutamate N-acetyltransferase/amino-acid N-acetyltransferase